MDQKRREAPQERDMGNTLRIDGRKPGELRPVRITRHYLKHPEGSVLIESGDTKVICTASVVEGVPVFLEGTGKGWVTAEYSMLPRATSTRSKRESKDGGRAQEIQRLVGRALRAVTRLEALGPRTIWIDCDVIQADGGTRTSAVTGAYVALVDALWVLRKRETVLETPVRNSISAISVGIVDGENLLDLNYAEDSKADVDMNFVITGTGTLVEVQGTAERTPFTKGKLDEMLSLALEGARHLQLIQQKALADAWIVLPGR